MAATKKSMAINEEKLRMRGDIDALVSRCKAACSKVPECVINGSANLAVAWRTAAEEAIAIEHRPADSSTSEDLRRRIVALNRTLGFLENPKGGL